MHPCRLSVATSRCKFDHFTRQNQLKVAETNDLKKAAEVIREVQEAGRNWPAVAAAAGVGKNRIAAIGRDHRLAVK